VGRAIEPWAMKVRRRARVCGKMPAEAPPKVQRTRPRPTPVQVFTVRTHFVFHCVRALVPCAECSTTIDSDVGAEEDNDAEFSQDPEEMKKRYAKFLESLLAMQEQQDILDHGGDAVAANHETADPDPDNNATQEVRLSLLILLGPVALTLRRANRCVVRAVWCD